MLQLMLMRHGKSDWETDAGSDHDRPLSNRGERASERMGLVVRELDLVPDVVVSSTARRARTTAELARITGGWSSRLVLDEALYGAGVSETLETAARHGGACTRIMLVGHQPTWSMVTRHLTGTMVDMRTATIANIDVNASDWKSLPDASGTLISVLQPRDYEEE
jgi:phosphohistidine phosphatase